MRFSSDLKADLKTNLIAGEARYRHKVFVEPLERLLRKSGVHSHRAASPALVDGVPVFACWINVMNL